MEAVMKEAGSRQRNYFWVCAVLPMGKIYVDGAYGTENEAYKAASMARELQGNYEIKEYPTINLQTANGHFKHDLVQRYNSLELAAQRVKHKI